MGRQSVIHALGMVSQLVPPKQKPTEENLTVYSFPTERALKKRYKVDEILEIGEVGIIDNVLVRSEEVIEEEDCQGCYFPNNEERLCINRIPLCSDKSKGIDVIFVEVKEEL